MKIFQTFPYKSNFLFIIPCVITRAVPLFFLMNYDYVQFIEND